MMPPASARRLDSGRPESDATCYFTTAGETRQGQAEMVLHGGASAGTRVFSVECLG
jgi:hypothetical protein